VGQVGFYDGHGQPTVAPFQPSVVPGQRFDWLRPAVFEEPDSSMLAISDRTQLYLLQVQQGTRAFLAASAEAMISHSKLSTQLAVAGDQLFVGTEDGRLARFSLPDLSAAEPTDVGGAIVWGPFAGGDGVLLETSDGQLKMVDRTGAIRWSQAYGIGSPSGEPLFDQRSALVVFPRQGVTQVALADGTPSRIDVGEPAIFGPTLLDEQLLLTTLDGTLLAVTRP
jgi:hypothetical protein